jgi:hypothetical protein
MKLTPADVFDALKSGAPRGLTEREIEEALDAAKMVHPDLPASQQAANQEVINLLSDALKKKRSEKP